MPNLLGILITACASVGISLGGAYIMVIRKTDNLEQRLSVIEKRLSFDYLSRIEESLTRIETRLDHLERMVERHVK